MEQKGNIIPKIIHCVWLSGEAKEGLQKKCLESWQRVMPDFEIKEWSLANLPVEMTEHPFVKSALSARKWAFATDYIRLWALYNYGGVYMDLDVMVYKSFTPFLAHRAFSCVEFNPRNFYNAVKKNQKEDIRGLNIEAAVMGSEMHHMWIGSMLKYYDELKFSADSKFMDSILMPLIVTRHTIPMGFRYIPIYQELKEGVAIYGPDVFSSCYDNSICRSDEEDITYNQTRYARHFCAHSWYENIEDKGLMWKFKHFIIKIIGEKRWNSYRRRNKENKRGLNKI